MSVYRTTLPNANANFQSTHSGVDYLGTLSVLGHLRCDDEPLAEVFAEQYLLLREYALDHPEAGAILAACA